MTRTPALRPLVALSASAALLLTACSSTSQPESASSAASSGGSSASSAAATSSSAGGQWTTPRDMPAGKGSNAADGVFPRTVAHFAGSTTIKAAPTKVAVLSTGQADALLALGMTPAGSTAADGAETIPAYLLTAYPQQKAALQSVTQLGDRKAPSIEKIAALAPDLILVNKAGKSDSGLYDKLSAIAPTIVTQGTGLYWKQDFLLLSDALGKRDEAKKWLDTFQSDAKTFGAGVANSPKVSLLRKNGNRVRVFGVASFAGSVLEDAGLPRPADQSFTDKTSTDLSGEQLKKADGDVIVYGVQNGDAKQLTSLPLWSSLTAVKTNKAFQVDDDAFYLNTGPTAARSCWTS